MLNFKKTIMDITQIQQSLRSILGSMTQPNIKVDDFKYNNLIAEKIKTLYSLEDRIKEYKGLIWASENPDFDFKSLIPDDEIYTIKFSKKEVYNILVDFKKFYETKEYNLLTDNRKPKDRWDF